MSTGAQGAVVITGSSTGIGRACALHLAGRGFQVFAGVRRPADGEALQGAADGGIEPLLVDVTDSEAVAAAAERVSEATGGRLAGLVNNAGIGVGGPLEGVPIDDLRRSLEVNVTAQVAVTQAFLPELRRARGRVIFMSSIGGRMATPFMGPYNASKFALEAVGDSLRQELRPWGIEVSIVEPGSIATPIWDKAAADGTIQERFGPEIKELYGHSMARFQDAVRKTAARGIPPERVAKAVAHALTARRPRTRYLVGIDAKIQAKLKRLVRDRPRDRLVARMIGV